MGSNEGVELAFIDPNLGIKSNIFRSEPLTITVGIRTNYPVHLIKVQIWTNLQHKTTPEAEWHGIDLDFVRKEKNDICIFRSSFMTEMPGTFEYTVRYSLRKLSTPMRNSSQNWLNRSLDEDIQWSWASKSGINGVVVVSEPNEQAWTQGPQVSEVAPGLFIGNLRAAAEAQARGFDAVLNMESKINIVLPQTIKYKQTRIDFEEISNFSREEEEELREIVAWLEQRLDQNAKTLMFCREGTTRCGPIAVAYTFYVHPEWNFSQACENIVKNCPGKSVEEYRSLQGILERIFPRSNKSNALLINRRTGSLQSFHSQSHLSTPVN